MKSYWGLILLALFTAFGAGYYALFLQGSYTASERDIIKIRNYKQNFLNKSYPLGTVNLQSYYPYYGQLPLITKPINLNTDRKQFETYIGHQDCFDNLSLSMGISNIKKAILWEQFRCKKRKTLPAHFFSDPPYMHPSGKSYMYLAYQLNPKTFARWDWISSRMNFFHLEELYELSPQWPKFSQTAFAKLLQLSPETLYKMARKKSPIVNGQFLYLKRSQNFFSSNHFTYDIFNFKKLKHSLWNTEFSIREKLPNEVCFYNNGDICWSYNLKYLFAIANKGSMAFFIFSLLVIIIALYLFFNKLKEQRREDERRRLALQVLSHEFRTPVSSLLLSTESLLNNSEHIDEKSQEDILRISSDVHRLHRLVELSRHYLKVSDGKNLVDLNKNHHPSFNLLIKNLLQEYENKITIIPTSNDHSISIDEYWLRICLKNLIENALNHGVKPVSLKLETYPKYYQISVSDQGSLPTHTDLSTLTHEFIKGNKSQGSGLGLNIVAKVIKDMNGKLKLKHSPTTFIIQLPQ